eukprot:COSAG01_NODE_4828_length_4710_cov_15.372587_6_plen_139_part_00
MRRVQVEDIIAFSTQLPTPSHPAGARAPSRQPRKKRQRQLAHRGIANLGNSCYLAAALQALVAAPDLLKGLHRSQTTTPPTDRMPESPVTAAVDGILQQLSTPYDAAQEEQDAVDIRPLARALGWQTGWAREQRDVDL